MNIFEKLTDKEKTLTENYISACAGDGGSSCDMKAPLNHILRIWDNSKKDFCHMLDNQLIYRQEIDFKRPVSILSDDICKMCDEHESFMREYERFIDEVCGAWSWDNYWSVNATTRRALEDLVSYDSLAKNIYEGVTFSFTDREGKEIKVNRGCKISKVLGKIAKRFDFQHYEDFRVAHSMCLNQKSMHGHLCISIHPMDFMTMSDNESDWTSCMSWEDDGCYRQGTVEMMNSPYVVMAYLASDNDMCVPGGTWNNKKWRQLFVVTPNLIMGIKPYPYRSLECEKMVLDILKEKAQSNMSWGPYTKDTVLVDNECHNSFSEINKTTYISLYMNHMYNDISEGHTAYVSLDFPEDYSLNLSGDSECMCCGDYIDEYEEDCALTCSHCSDNRTYCSCCGARILEDDEYIFEDEVYCEDCYNNNVGHCEYSDREVRQEDIAQVYVAHNDAIYAMSFYCDMNCFEEDHFKEIFGEAKPYFNGKCYGVEIDNFKDEEAWPFFIWGEMDNAKFKHQIESGTISPVNHYWS